MRATFLALAMMAASPLAAQGTDARFEQIFGARAGATEIASAVADCVAQDGDVARLTGAGWTKVDAFGGGQMMAYRRGDQGPILALPAKSNPLRCWIMARPSDDEATTTKAIDGRLGVAAIGTTWRVGPHAVRMDWGATPDQRPVTRIEVYKIPQESK
ncbi:MAG: hypothetical protein ACK4TC_16005 [Sphingomonas pseudosanguinis]|uniref:hypothetical protein n=1 Tax=Sphingomonas pseudosanguinis TaxID=413712 RepID=UPI0039188B14